METSWNCYSVSWKSGDFFHVKQHKTILFLIRCSSLSSFHVLQVVFLYYLLWYMSKARIFKTSIFRKWVFYFSAFVFQFETYETRVKNLKISVGCKSKFWQLDLLEMKRKCTLSPPVIFAIAVMIWLRDLKKLFFLSLSHFCLLKPD